MKDKAEYIVLTRAEILQNYGDPDSYEKALAVAKRQCSDGAVFLCRVEKVVKIEKTVVHDFDPDQF